MSGPISEERLGCSIAINEVNVPGRIHIISYSGDAMEFFFGRIRLSSDAEFPSLLDKEIPIHLEDGRGGVVRCVAVKKPALAKALDLDFIVGSAGIK